MPTHTNLITDTGDAGRLLKYMRDAIHQGDHPNPHNEFVQIRLDVLNKPRTHDQQQRADTAARDWLTSIGSEPS